MTFHVRVGDASIKALGWDPEFTGFQSLPQLDSISDPELDLSETEAVHELGIGGF
jgi:hypothetical protein